MVKKVSSTSLFMPAGRHARSWIACAATSGLAMLAFAGCTGDVNPQPTFTQSNGYVEPAWMAANRQDQEENAIKFADCMTQAGWETTVKPDHSFSGPLGLTEAQELAQMAAGEICGEQVFDELPVDDAAFWRMKYAHALDTAACLTAAGYAIPDPPSEDVWVDALLSSGYSIWTPFDSVVNRGDLDMATYYALFDQCPQDGPTVVMSK